MIRFGFRSISCFFFIFLSSFSGICSESKCELVVYTYDSLMAPEGLGPALFSLFEKKYQCQVRAITSGDGGQILSRLQLDHQRGKSPAHLVLGIDQPVWEQAKGQLEGWEDWVPEGYSKIPNQLRVEKGFLPYDYGPFALMGDRKAMEEKKLPIPHSLQDLLKPEWKRNVILEDPRTSTPGLSFLLFTQAILGDGQQSFWRKFRSQWLTLAPGWDQAYQLFLKKEAPLVWSYLTSQAYQDEHSLDRGSSPRRYEALLFQEGQPVQIEGAAWIRGALKTPRDKEMAKQFFSFLLSPEAQGLIPKKNWMLPIRSDVVLPPSFKNLPVPTRLISITAKSSEIQQALTRWQLSLRE